MFLLLACTPRMVHPEPPEAVPAFDGPAKMLEIQWGDSLFDISSRYGLPGGWVELAEHNEVWDPDYVQAGELLQVFVDDPSLPDWPAYGPVDGDLDTCDVAVSEVPAGPGLPPGFCASPMLRIEAQLDSDGQREVLYGCPTEVAEDVGMSTWKVGIVDGPALVQTVELGNFGETSVVEGERGCELLVSTWEAAPLGMTQAWLLTGRRMRLQGGELRPSSEELRSRRLTYDFEPGEVAEDLSHRQARARNIEPSLQGEIVRQSRGPLPAELPQWSRVGDQATGLLYPPGYRPRSAGQVLIEERRINAWGNTRTIYWL